MMRTEHQHQRLDEVHEDETDHNILQDDDCKPKHGKKSNSQLRPES
jgi:hypothetical protein